ncbi:MAG: zinc ribbon domain-containing protein [Candidatus Dormibacteria bacterium]
MSRAGDLLVLTEIDSRIAGDRARLARDEARLARDEMLEDLRRELRRANRAQRTADAAVAEQEAAVAALRRRLSEVDRHLYDGSVRNPQELLSMQHELETVRARVAAAEEVELGLMERAEAAATTVRELAQRLDETEAQHRAAVPALSAEVAALHAALEGLADERNTLLASMNTADLALYGRLHERVSPPVVHLQGDACGGCHLPFAASEIRALRAGAAPVQCSSCDRIVVP